MSNVLDDNPAPLVGPLGALEDTFDPRTVKFSAALKQAGPMPRPGSSRRYSLTEEGGAIKRSAHGNNKYGSCVFTTHANLDETVCAHTGATPITNEQIVLAGYDKHTDFDLETGANDNGASMLDGVRWAKSIGLFSDYAEVDTSDQEEVDLALDLTMGVQIALALPVAWRSRKVWDTIPDSDRDSAWKYGSWGGHSVCIVDQDRRGYTIVTWGGYKLLTRPALASYRKHNAFAGFHHALAKTQDGDLTPTGRTAAAIKALLPHV